MKKNNKGEGKFLLVTVVFTIAVFVAGFYTVNRSKREVDKKIIEETLNNGNGLYITWSEGENNDGEIVSFMIREGELYRYRDGNYDMAYNYKVSLKSKDYLLKMECPGEKNFHYPVYLDKNVSPEEIVIVTDNGEEVHVEDVPYLEPEKVQNLNAFINELSNDILSKSIDNINSEIAEYKSLTKWDKAYIENPEIFKKAIDSVNVALATEVQAEISRLKTFDENSVQFIKKVKEDYNNLTEEQKALVKNYPILETAEDRYNAYRAKIVDSMIIGIGKVSLKSRVMLENTRIEYDKLTEEQKSKVENLGILLAAEKKYSTLRINKTNKLIAKLEDVSTVTEEDVEKAKESYNLCNEEQKKALENVEWLISIDKRMDEKAARNFDEKVKALSREKITWKSEDVIKDVKETYEALTESQKKMIEMYGAYQSIYSNYETLMIAHFDELVASIGKVTLKSEAAINTALDYYNSMPSETRDKVKVGDLHTARDKYNSLVEIEKTKLRIGEKVKTSTWEVTLEHVYMTSRVNPDDTDGYYWYKTPSNDYSIFLDIVLKIKNISTKSKSLDDVIEVTSVNYGGISYEMDADLYDASGSSLDYVASWDSMSALGSGRYHLLIEMPKEAKSNGMSLFVNCKIDGVLRRITYRE